MSRITLALAVLFGLGSLGSIQAATAPMERPTFHQLSQAVANLSTDSPDVIQLAGCPPHGRPYPGHGYGYRYPNHGRYYQSTRYRGYGHPGYYPRGGYYNSYYRGSSFGRYGYGYPGYSRGSGFGLYIGF